MLVLIIESPPRELSELEVAMLEFVAEKKKMGQKNKWLQEEMENWKNYVEIE